MGLKYAVRFFPFKAGFFPVEDRRKQAKELESGINKSAASGWRVTSFQPEDLGVWVLFETDDTEPKAEA